MSRDSWVDAATADSARLAALFWRDGMPRGRVRLAVYHWALRVHLWAWRHGVRLRFRRVTG